MADQEWHTVSTKSNHHHTTPKQQARRKSKQAGVPGRSAASNSTGQSQMPQSYSDSVERSNPFHMPEDSSDDEEYEGNNETEEAHNPPYHTIVVIGCPFDNCSLCAPIINTTALAQHLREEHHLVFKDLHHMYVALDAYLSRWAQEFEKKPLEEHGSKHPVDANVYLIGPETNAVDKAIREELQQNKLNEVLKIQQMEREKDSKQPRKCLFCKIVCDNRSALFKHMFVEHNFNIGLPDNLVNANQFLSILEDKLTNLQCLYCQKTFTNATVLRKHMRKKKHFKIASRNRQYDRFYVINYIEPGKNWESFEKDNYESDDEKRDESWADWDEEEPEPTMCLFDDIVLPSPNEALLHMKDEHQFNLTKLRKEKGYDFYQTVVLINYIRHQSSINKCFSCGQTVDDISQMASHLKDKGCMEAFVSPTAEFWKDPCYLLPTYEDDPLLTGFDLADDIELEDLKLSDKDANAKFMLQAKIEGLPAMSDTKKTSVPASKKDRE